MNEIEKKLIKEKERISSLTAPRELDDRLRGALEGLPKRKRRLSSFGSLIAAAILLFTFAGYHYNALAFYGKKILDFDEVITGTLQELNDEGKGQVVNQSYHFGNGAMVTIDGVMTDENRMIIYYTLTNPTGLGDTFSELFHPEKITGWFTDSNYEGGRGVINEMNTELKGTMDFEPPSPFSKELTLHFLQRDQNGISTRHSISFPYKPNKALQTEIKQAINKSINVDGGKIEFNSFIASPTLTVIRGYHHIEGFGRIHQPLGGIQLIANGKAVDPKGMGTSSTIAGGQEFELEYDALPKPLHSLEILLKKFIGYTKVDQRFPLFKQTVNLNGKELFIKKVNTTSNRVEVTIATAESLLLDKVSIQTVDGAVELQSTINQSVQKQRDGSLIKERTLLFDTNSEPKSMYVGGIHYMKIYNKIIEIPLK